MPNLKLVRTGCQRRATTFRRAGPPHSKTLGLAMTIATSMTADPERLAFPRLLVRSAILGAFVPVTQGDFWDVKAVQVVSALVLCVVLYGLEKAVLYPFRKRMTIKPLSAWGSSSLRPIVRNAVFLGGERRHKSGLSNASEPSSGRWPSIDR